MSHAINRAEIIEVIFKGEGEPVKVCPYESSRSTMSNSATSTSSSVLTWRMSTSTRLSLTGMPKVTACSQTASGSIPSSASGTMTTEGQHWVATAELLIEHQEEGRHGGGAAQLNLWRG